MNGISPLKILHQFKKIEKNINLHTYKIHNPSMFRQTKFTCVLTQTATRMVIHFS